VFELVLHVDVVYVLLVPGVLVMLELDPNLFYNSLHVHLCCKKACRVGDYEGGDEGETIANQLF
jgi:hypothetical protein